MKYKYKELNVEPYLDEIESGWTEKMESYMIAEINDEDYPWAEVDEIGGDGLYVTDFDCYLYMLVHDGKIIFEIF